MYAHYNFEASPLSRVLLVIVRQAMFGLVVFVLSLLVLGTLQRAIGLGAPPMSGVVLVGSSVIFACASGGVLGMTIGTAARARRLNAAPLLALLAGLIWGGILCGTVAPLYIEYALEAMLREGVGQIVRERDMLLNRDSRLQYAVDAVKTLALRGSGRLPILSLLVWVVLGPSIAGGLEARRSLRR